MAVASLYSQQGNRTFELSYRTVSRKYSIIDYHNKKYLIYGLIQLMYLLLYIKNSVKESKLNDKWVYTW